MTVTNHLYKILDRISLTTSGGISSLLNKKLMALIMVVGPQSYFVALNYLEAVDKSHIFGCQLEIEDVCVLFYAVFMYGFWYGHDAVLYIPSENDLRRRLAVLLPDPF